MAREQGESEVDCRILGSIIRCCGSGGVCLPWKINYPLPKTPPQTSNPITVRGSFTSAIRDNSATSSYIYAPDASGGLERPIVLAIAFKIPYIAIHGRDRFSHSSR